MSKSFWSLEALRTSTLYSYLRLEFTYHSNRIEGSTFSKEELAILIDKDIASGTHPYNDLIESRNSITAFEWVLESLGESITKSSLLDFHVLLKRGSRDDERGFVGKWKSIPNMIMGSDVRLANPWEVDKCIERLLDWWENCDKSFEDVVRFHADFEMIHPFHDGNGRVGRLIMLKQCLEQGYTPVIVEEGKEYKKCLSFAQQAGVLADLEDLFRRYQGRLEAQDIVKETRKNMGLL